jgi:hypothetical protein
MNNKKPPTIKDLEKIQDSESSLSEILKVHMREPFSDSDIKFIDTHFERFGRKGCVVNFQSFNPEKTKNDGYLIFELPQLYLRLLYVKVYGGKGWLGKKIHYSIFLQELDEKIWVPISVQKTLMLSISAIGNLFRDKGLLKGFGI